MSPEQTKLLMQSSPLAWIALNKFVSENQRVIEFKNHRFMIDIYADNSPDICCIKSAQVGYSTFAILKSFHELKYEKRNILYALPTRNVVQDFVVPKVNPLISSNPLIAKEMGSDSVSLKKLGNRFIYFKGGSEREAISVSADTLVIDEYDRMPDMSVVTMFDSRLQAAIEPRRRRFSNPSSVGFGVDGLYQDSDQRHWFVSCPHCNHEWFIDFERTSDKCHYVDKGKAIFACGRCGKELSDTDRRNGRWVAKHPKRARHGYWMSQMMAPWVSATRIIEQEAEMSIETFHGFVLGKAYTPSDMVVNRQTILRACMPSLIPRTGVAMGVDQKASEMEWVAGTSRGIFAYGRAKSWEEIEQLKLSWGAVVVADNMPYPTGPVQLAKKYRDFYCCTFKNVNGLDIVDWSKPGVVYVDRTKGLDLIAKEITDCRLLFRMRPNELEEYIADWKNLYRTTVEENDGRVKTTWLKKDSSESDFPFATLYFRVALSRIMGSSSFLAEPMGELSAPITDTASTNQSVALQTLQESVRDTLATLE